MISSIDEAKPAKTQHKTPCHDCPFRRRAIPGWLGGYTPQEYAMLANSDARIDCHTKKPHPDKPGFQAQCAGAAIYRANTFKNPRPTESGFVPLSLPKSDAVLAFDFVKHHQED